MIKLYGLTYRVPQYAEKSIESILKNASEPIDFTVVDNLSSGSEKIRAYLRQLVSEKRISRALLMNCNAIGWGLVQAIQDFPPDDSETFFCVTDLDLVVPEGCDWVKTIRKAHEGGAKLTGCTLDISNYVNTPNHGYGGDEDGFGIWLQGINKESFFKHYTLGQNLIDSSMIAAIRNSGGSVQKLLDIRLYHLAWDLWKDDPEYFQFKKINPGWVYQGKPPGLAYNLISANKN